MMTATGSVGLHNAVERSVTSAEACADIRIAHPIPRLGAFNSELGTARAACKPDSTEKNGEGHLRRGKWRGRNLQDCQSGTTRLYEPFVAGETNTLDIARYRERIRLQLLQAQIAKHTNELLFSRSPLASLQFPN